MPGETENMTATEPEWKLYTSLFVCLFFSPATFSEQTDLQSYQKQINKPLNCLKYQFSP